MNTPTASTGNTVSDRYLAGAKNLSAMGGDINAIAEPLAGIAPDLATYVAEFAFGDIYGRPGLDLKTRQLITIAALTTLGDTERQLKFHIRAARRIGVTTVEITEVIIHMLPFAGNPRVFNAMLAAKDALNE